MENVFVWQQKIITHIIYATKRGFSIPPSVLVVLKRAGQRENSNEFERKANAEDHPSFSTRGDTQIPDRSLLFQNACQRVKHSLRDLEPTSYSTTAETKKKPFKTTGMIYEWGPETSTILIVGNARLGQRYVQDILSLAPEPMENLGGPHDRFLWFSMVTPLLRSACQPQTLDAGRLVCTLANSNNNLCVSG